MECVFNYEFDILFFGKGFEFVFEEFVGGDICFKVGFCDFF